MLATEKSVLRYESGNNKLISSILVPVDFSVRSAGAANFALSLAARFDAKVTLLHVEKPLEGDSFWTTEAARWAKEQMADFLPESRNYPDVTRIVSLHPDISDEILRVAAETGTDLIAMPTRGYGVIGRTLLGSIAARVLDGAVCPVWTSTHAQHVLPSRWMEPERIACAVDSVPEGARALSWASALASKLNAKLCVAWSRKGLTETREEFDRLERSHRIYVENVIEGENIPNALRRAVTKMQADLLVIGRNSWKSSAEAGLDMYQVIRKVPCPLVSM